MSNWPDTLSINARTGSGDVAASPTDQGTLGWALAQQLEVSDKLAAPEPLDLRDWRNPGVGWGLILPEDDSTDGGPNQAKANAEDAPDCIRRLLADRPGSPVLRYRRGELRFLRRYYADGNAEDIAVSGAPQGTGKSRLPRYLLIAGSPTQIPWQIQYLLNASAFVGRLDLPEEALSNYIDFLIDDWSSSSAVANRPVVWAADHGHPDISWLMRRVIAKPVAEMYRADSQIGDQLREMGAETASIEGLTDSLSQRKPALVVTTSHGMTGPLDDSALMARQLGLLMATDNALLDPDTLLNHWQPDGAIWYAHACCSAGSDDGTRYQGLVTAGSFVDQILTGVGALGAQIAPLPQALLSADKPLRAFIGQVEPTFDWTIRQPETKQLLTSTLQSALYNHLYRAEPETVGMAFEASYDLVGQLFGQWHAAQRNFNDGVVNAEVVALRTQLAAMDRQSMVILGDPTVSLPPLG